MTLPSLPVQRIQNGVLVQGQALRDTALLVALGLRYGLRDAFPPPRMRYLADLYADAARDESACGPADFRDAADPPSSLADEITTAEASQLLGIGARQVRRLAPLLGARRTAAGWLIHRGAVLAHHHHERTAA
jgi:hypothetical protein